MLVANFAEGNVIGGGGDATSNYLPTYNYYNYSLTEQIYTSAELGNAGIITSIAFYNGGTEKTRTLDFYMKSTDKNSFSGDTDWIAVSASDKVFSGSVTFTADDWTMVTFSTPFVYDGTSNVVLVTDDNTGSYTSSPHMACRVFDATGQAIYGYSDGTNYDPLNPTSYSGTLTDNKNQIQLSKEAFSTDPINITVSAIPARGGSVSGSGVFYMGDVCTVTATPNEGFSFDGWMENGVIVSYETTLSFSVVHDRDLVAMFNEGTVIGGGTETNAFLPSYNYYNYSLTQQIYTAAEIGSAGKISSIAFYNGGATKTRTYDFYLVATNKTSFDNSTDWVAVTDNDKVFSGEVTMTANVWTTITFDTPFEYDGTSNLIIVADDNTGSYSSSPHMTCRVFEATGQAIYVYNDNTNYDPTDPTANGTILNVKNQISFGISTAQTFYKPISAYTGNGGYVLLASPVGILNPAEVTNMLQNNFDLYAFDQNQDLEWVNYNTNHFNIESGKGYLYANSSNVTLEFIGEPYNGNGEVTLGKTDNVEFSGWNLVGNPFSQTAYLNRDFYVMNNDGSELTIAERNYVEAMEGIFVHADNDGEALIFSTTPVSKEAALVINIAGNTRGGVIDRAIVRFNEGQLLPKFQLNVNSTKIYIPQFGQDYAVVNAEAMGELPVNFKAEKDGNYTISISANEMSFGYLHLIDNLTGADVDLLETPSYTFEAKTSDYASRFKVVFMTEENNLNNNDSFAFISNGDIIINGQGTVQVVDALGRIVISRDGVHAISTNEMAKGVYMLRLIDGDNTKTQTIIVK